MAIINTTTRSFTVEESYEDILILLFNKEIEYFPLTEILTSYSDFPDFKTHTTKRKILLRKNCIEMIM